MTTTQNHESSAVADDSQVVLDLLRRQRDLYAQLQSLGADQSTFIRQGATEQLLSLLAKRQNLVDQLGQVAAQIAPHRDQIAELARAQSSGEIKLLVDEIRGLLEQIIVQDDAGRKDLEAARDGVAGQLRQVTGAGVAAGAYQSQASSGPTPSRFTDQRG